MNVKHLPAMTLAFLYASGPDGKREAHDKISAFLTHIGLSIDSTKKYFFPITISKGSQTVISYMMFASVPAGTSPSKEVAVIDLAGGEYLTFTTSKSEFESDQGASHAKMQEAMNGWLKENKRQIDMRKVIGLIEEDYVDGYEMYNIYFPLK